MSGGSESMITPPSISSSSTIYPPLKRSFVGTTGMGRSSKVIDFLHLVGSVSSGIAITSSGIANTSGDTSGMTTTGTSGTSGTITTTGVSGTGGNSASPGVV